MGDNILDGTNSADKIRKDRNRQEKIDKYLDEQMYMIEKLEKHGFITKKEGEKRFDLACSKIQTIFPIED